MRSQHSDKMLLRTALFFVMVQTAGTDILARESPPTFLAFVQVPVNYKQICGTDIGNTLLASRYSIGSRLILSEWDRVDQSVQVISDGFVSVADPSFSHDGERLLFSGTRQPNQPLQIWELGSGEPQPRQVVQSDTDCINPIFMPNRHIVFSSLLSREYEEHGGQLSFSLYQVAPGEQQPSRLTFNPSSEFDPCVLPDGRIVFSSWQHVGNHFWPRGIVSLMLVNSDGTGIFPLTGNHQGEWLKRGAKPFGDDSIAFIQTQPDYEFGAGALMATSLNDSFSPYATLISSQTHLVEGVTPMPDGRLLVSARPVDGSRPTFGLYVLEKSGALSLLYDDPMFHEISPAIGMSGKKPDQRISTVVEGTPHGYLLVLDCLDTDRQGAVGLRREDVQTVRLIEGLPLKSDGNTKPTFTSLEGREDEPLIHPGSATGYIPSRILGEVSPALDGSIYIKVPADRPLRLQLVDREGFTIMNERAWFWVRPNERRVCIGCHENRELSPSNNVPLATRSEPIDLTNPNGWRTVTFQKDIEPILQANCTNSHCHVPPRPTAAMNLTSRRFNGAKDAPMTELYGPAYASLMARQDGKPYAIGGRRVHPGNSRRSPLLWMLYGRTLAPQYAPAPFERPLLDPHPDTPLTTSEIDLIRTWIDLGAVYDDSRTPVEWPVHDSARTYSTEGKNNED
ncbi:MAG: PD40 domain-containing protein [Planctomycetes bacterium]|nr:PD40 domain-containing protein [Planctomycetota bacterium]